jgi:hypothetical protein
MITGKQPGDLRLDEYLDLRWGPAVASGVYHISVRSLDDRSDPRVIRIRYYVQDDDGGHVIGFLPAGQYPIFDDESRYTYIRTREEA